MAEPTLYLFDGFNLLHAGDFGSTSELRDLLTKVDRSEDLEAILDRVLQNSQELEKFSASLGIASPAANGDGAAP